MIKEKIVHRGYRVTFDSTGCWSFDNSTARNAIIFGFDNTLSFHTDNRKSNFLIRVKDPTFRINGSFDSVKHAQNFA